jgi:hypothetical protein
LQAAKKDKQRRFVEIFAEKLGPFPPGKLIDSESPDFLVATPEGVIGIEVTKIHHADKRRQQESECRSLVDAACRLYESESTIPLEVKVHFGGSTQFNKRNRDKFARILANLILTNMPQPDSGIILENSWENSSLFTTKSRDYLSFAFRHSVETFGPFRLRVSFKRTSLPKLRLSSQPKSMRSAPTERTVSRDGC